MDEMRKKILNKFKNEDNNISTEHMDKEIKQYIQLMNINIV